MLITGFIWMYQIYMYSSSNLILIWLSGLKNIYIMLAVSSGACVLNARGKNVKNHWHAAFNIHLIVKHIFSSVFVIFWQEVLPDSGFHSPTDFRRIFEWTAQRAAICSHFINYRHEWNSELIFFEHVVQVCIDTHSPIQK